MPKDLPMKLIYEFPLYIYSYVTDIRIEKMPFVFGVPNKCSSTNILLKEYRTKKAAK